MPGGLSSREWMRLMIFCLFGAIMTAVALWFSQTDAPAEEFAPAAPKVEVANVVRPDRPWDPHKRVLNEMISETTRTDRVKVTPDALQLLATDVWDWPHEWFKHDAEREAVGGFRPVSLEELCDINKSELNRGEPVEIVGYLVESGPLSLKDDLGLDPTPFETDTVFGGILRGDDGREARIILLARGETTVHFAPTARVRAQGVFYRLEDSKRPKADGGEAEYATLPILLTKKIAPLIPLELIDELPANFADSIVDATDAGDKRRVLHKEWSFYQLLGYAMKHWGESSSEKPILLEGRGYLERPEEYRLKSVRVRGQLIYLHWESFEYPESREGDAPILGYWHVMISDTNPGENAPVSVIIPTKELPAGFVKNSLVEVDGLYYRVLAYSGRATQKHGSRINRTPVVIATVLPKEQPQKEEFSMQPLILGFVAVGLVLAFGLTFMLSRDRRRAAELEKKLRDHRIERRRTQGMDLNKDARSLDN